jgi:hypothetical protein
MKKRSRKGLRDEKGKSFKRILMKSISKRLSGGINGISCSWKHGRIRDTKVMYRKGKHRGTIKNKKLGSI